MRCFFSRYSIKQYRSINDDTHDLQSGKISTVGGHSENFSEKDGFLIKKSNRTEARFYEQLMNNQFMLSDFVPACTDVEYCVNTETLKNTKQEYSKITLEDLRQGFVNPLIYDIKLGIKTISSKELVASGSTRSEIMCKDLRLHIADNVSSTAKRGYRFVGSSACHESRLYLATHPDEMIQDIATRLSYKDLSCVIDELDRLTTYFFTKEGRRLEIIGASILIVAEKDSFSSNDIHCAKPKVKLIDFAHSNIVTDNNSFLSNMVLSTPHRKKVYQHGLRHGIINLADDLRVLLEQKIVNDG